MWTRRVGDAQGFGAPVATGAGGYSVTRMSSFRRGGTLVTSLERDRGDL
ncbi:hypothetical protein BTZ20_4086 [Rhodococcus sp. MTM3W5.2]|nr:hypothetical protein BTZ20_4086 [Rhodococcus sp. MTM3W5.2]